MTNFPTYGLVRFCIHLREGRPACAYVFRILQSPRTHHSSVPITDNSGVEESTLANGTLIGGACVPLYSFDVSTSLHIF